jgi:hypothetical protein
MLCSRIHDFYIFILAPDLVSVSFYQSDPMEGLFLTRGGSIRAATGYHLTQSHAPSLV